ncbi:PepSY domain-containing protein [Bacillus aquiflavi]|uniref:PepSY domain-containing protein n=1 Tax=Bacillus aquiflavi TaxID=2672567 RepID=A0A6B3W258_9BACI|nr:PepSY domain-containing protein [Bacillus aquiflavi]MBA4537714.1 PepSY domain-containing protein [Bacillus aquiflavi]NEY81971.1 hypothetical protein [Bacillus aquiflavi]UAC47593.1 PepSY domain-containing protein [Bacillus aquiflavi]
MNWKTLLAGLGIGFIGGYLTKGLIDEKSTISPEKVLDNVKAAFKKEGPITGSWIQIQSEPYVSKQLQYEVFKGGISRNHNGEKEQFEFIADASTGTVIDLYPIQIEKSLSN